jgi:cold shock CspA family protein
MAIEKGVISRLIKDRGFGFVRPNDWRPGDGRNSDCFFHAKSVRDAIFEALVEGQEVEFSVTVADGRARCDFVSPV